MPDFDYPVGGHVIRLPEGHALPEYQSHWKRYDFILGELARVVSEKYPGSPRIDIGANVGDSWALMNKYVVSETLLIEGDTTYANLLGFNLARLGHPAQISKVFCGPESGGVPDAHIRRTAAGTSSIQKDTPIAAQGGAGANVPVLTFREIIDQYPRFRDSKLIKLDTDGYDFGIIEANAALFSEMQATLFYECAPFEAAHGMRDSISSFSEITKFFRHFIVYDNFGHFMCSLDGPDLFERYLELMVFLASNRVDGTAVYYFDIAAFTPENRDLYSILREFDTSRFFGRRNTN